MKEVRGYFEASLTKLKQEVAKAAGDAMTEPRSALRKATRPRRFGCTIGSRNSSALSTAAMPIATCRFTTAVSSSPKSTATIPAQRRRTRVSCWPTRFPTGIWRLGLDLLARDDDEKTYKRVFIDYKSLGVRQLGSIYEGLLEFRLRIAPEKMAVCKGKKTEEIIPYAEAKQGEAEDPDKRQGEDAAERTLAKGAVYLENDKRERKATGSYYTPDYIVQYIVANTVGPVLNERMERVRGQLREAQKAVRREREKAQELQRRYGKADDAASARRSSSIAMSSTRCSTSRCSIRRWAPGTSWSRPSTSSPTACSTS